MATKRIVPELSRYREREALRLRLQGKSHTEIAAELKVTRQAVGQILRRAEKIERVQFTEELAKIQLRHVRTLSGVADRLVWRLNRGEDRPGELHLLLECLRDVRQILAGQAARWKEGTLEEAAQPGESGRLDNLQIVGAERGVTWGPMLRNLRRLEELTFGFRTGRRGRPAEGGCAVAPEDIPPVGHRDDDQPRAIAT
jgi:DNA-binding CsgD family transcriptional regulator